MRRHQILHCRTAKIILQHAGELHAVVLNRPAMGPTCTARCTMSNFTGVATEPRALVQDLWWSTKEVDCSAAVGHCMQMVWHSPLAAMEVDPIAGSHKKRKKKNSSKLHCTARCTSPCVVGELYVRGSIGLPCSSNQRSVGVARWTAMKRSPPSHHWNQWSRWGWGSRGSVGVTRRIWEDSRQIWGTRMSVAAARCRVGSMGFGRRSDSGCRRAGSHEDWLRRCSANHG